MKKKIIIALTVVFALCLAVTVFALNKSNVSSKAAMDCCDKPDNCPMKSKSAATVAKADCCDNMDNCPLKKQNTEHQTSEIDMKNVPVVTDGADCCQPGADCCKGGSCCKAKHKS